MTRVLSAEQLDTRKSSRRTAVQTSMALATAQLAGCAATQSLGTTAVPALERTAPALLPVQLQINGSTQSRSLYATPHRMTTHRAVKLDQPISESIRAPGAGGGPAGAGCSAWALAWQPPRATTC